MIEQEDTTARIKPLYEQLIRQERTIHHLRETIRALEWQRDDLLIDIDWLIAQLKCRDHE